MFKNKKLYRIEYKVFNSCFNTIIEAKDEFQALKKFKREVKYRDTGFLIICFKEIQSDYFKEDAIVCNGCNKCKCDFDEFPFTASFCSNGEYKVVIKDKVEKIERVD